MKKFIATAIAIFVTMFGATFASAATSEDCAESDDTPPGIECTVDANGNYPPVIPTNVAGVSTVVTLPPLTIPTDVLPVTGSSGMSNMLQISTLFLAGGLIVAAVSRRRSTAPTVSRQLRRFGDP